MVKSNWAYNLLLETFKQYYEKNPVSILTKAEEAIKQLQEVQKKELNALSRCIKSEQFDSTYFTSEANEGQDASRQNQTIIVSTNIKTDKDALVGSQKDNKDMLNEDIPAPKWVPPVKKEFQSERVRTLIPTRTKSKIQSNMRDSDVIFENVSVSLIDLTEEDEIESINGATRRTKGKIDVEAAKEVNVDTKRKTRTKTPGSTINITEEFEESNAVITETRSTETTIIKGNPVEEFSEIGAEVRTTKSKTIRKDDSSIVFQLEPANSTFVLPKLTHIIPETKQIKEEEQQYQLDNTDQRESFTADGSIQKEQNCQIDPREYAQKQQVRKQVQKKNGALLAYKAEQLRKQNEERNLKTQQQLNALEKNKFKHLEKSELDKLKQRELERDEIYKKFLQKREQKRKEQQERLLNAKKQPLERKPIYLITKPDMLTPDDYDSDDLNFRNTTVKCPSWCTVRSKEFQLSMMCAGHKLKNTLFCAKSIPVNLVEIFERIEETKLKRTSSGIWRTPPRYTMMSVEVLNKTKFSDDEDVFEDCL